MPKPVIQKERRDLYGIRLSDTQFVKNGKCVRGYTNTTNSLAEAKTWNYKSGADLWLKKFKSGIHTINPNDVDDIYAGVVVLKIKTTITVD